MMTALDEIIAEILFGAFSRFAKALTKFSYFFIQYLSATLNLRPQR